MATIREMFVKFFGTGYEMFINILKESPMTYDPEDQSYKISYNVMVDDLGNEAMMSIKFKMDHDNKCINIVRESNDLRINNGTSTIKMLSAFGQEVLMQCNNCYASYLEKEEKKRKLAEERRRAEELENRRISENLGGFFEMEIEKDIEF